MKGTTLRPPLRSGEAAEQSATLHAALRQILDRLRPEVEASRKRAHANRQPCGLGTLSPARERNFWLVQPFSMNGATVGPGADDSGGAGHKGRPPADSVRGGDHCAPRGRAARG
jgi:hypothetical protein